MTMAEHTPLLHRRGAAEPLPSQPSLLGMDAQPLVEPAILHVRIADFAATVAARARPDLDGRALIVGNAADGRGLVLAASPAARADGVASGMTLREAEKLCPRVVALPADPEALSGAAREALAILGCYTPVVEPDWLRADGKRRRKAGPADWEKLAHTFGATLDVRGCERLFGPPHRMAARIAEHLAECGYAARIGVAANPSLAAVASAVAGIDETRPSPCLVAAGQERAFLDGLPLALLSAVDDDLLEHLRVLGIRKAGQLARLPTAGVRRRFGPAGESAQAQARGEARRPLVVPSAPPTLEAACALEEPATEAPRLEQALARLAARLARQLAARGQSASLLTLRVTVMTQASLETSPRPGPDTAVSGRVTAVGGPDGEVCERSLHLKEPVAGEAAILARARELLIQMAPDGPVAALAITLADLGTAATQLSFPLLTGNGARVRDDMEVVTQRLCRRFGPRAARRVRLVEALLPEERVVWDGPDGASGRRVLSLAVRADAAGRPLALRRGVGHWEPVRTICAHWRLRTRWWAEVTHRHYYLVETAAGALLENYHEQRDGRWHLTGRRD
jgi:nucleotidyltransferase/DNA polymerase involved in DNA repair